MSDGKRSLGDCGVIEIKGVGCREGGSAVKREFISVAR